MYISTPTSKHQAATPAEVRKQLELHSGDKVGPFDLEYHQALESTLSEWSSNPDDEAYNDL